MVFSVTTAPSRQKKATIKKITETHTKIIEITTGISPHLLPSEMVQKWLICIPHTKAKNNTVIPNKNPSQPMNLFQSAEIFQSQNHAVFSGESAPARKKREPTKTPASNHEIISLIIISHHLLFL